MGDDAPVPAGGSSKGATKTAVRKTKKKAAAADSNKAASKVAKRNKAPTKKASAKKTSAKAAGKKRKRAKARDDRPLVLVTGAAGGLGRLVCRKLHRRYRVFGIDRRPFPDRPKDIEHLRIDLRRKSAATAIKKMKPDAIVHLGVIHNPHAGEAFRFNLEGTAQLLRTAEAAGVDKFVYLSSANLYGPSATSSGFLTEEAPLMGAGRSPEVRDLISLDMMVQSLFWKRPQSETVILRPVHIVGPHLRNAPSKYFRLNRIPTILGFDPMIQLVHELDLVDAMLKSLEPGVRGVFNIAGAGQAPLSRLINARSAQQLYVPGPIFVGALDRMFQLHITQFPPSELDHLRYACLVDDRRSREELGYTPQRSMLETLADLD
jgi:UDP-glucose 4-epimerase